MATTRTPSHHSRLLNRWSGGAALTALALAAGPGVSADFDREPINYGSAADDNPVARLGAGVAAGKVKLDRDPKTGHLKSLLAALHIPGSSQVMVFSKTSFQRGRIAPKTPRAVYFNDDVYVGFCRKGDVLEVSAADPGLGTAFYTVDQSPKGPKVSRQHEHCTLCHASSLNGGVPGHIVRSTPTDEAGNPRLSAVSYREDYTTPLKNRWGGWYVTGTHGRQAHLGNVAGPGPAGLNVTDLGGRFDTAAYLTPHSDLVALMVLDHQAAVHNQIARAALQTRVALFDDVRRGRGKPGEPSEAARDVIRSVGDDLVKALLFSGEAKLAGPVKGTSPFAGEFAEWGPFDDRGRSLREFDLSTRLFKYPCSYLVYSDSFARLPAEVKEYVLRRLYEVLTGTETGADFAHLAAGDRRAVRDILRAAVPGLPAYWRVAN